MALLGVILRWGVSVMSHCLSSAAICLPPGVACGSAWVIARACSSVARNASGEEISGFGASARTTTAIPTRARRLRLPGRILPAASSAPISGTGRRTTSAFSPASSRCWIAPTTAKVKATERLVAFSNSGANSFNVSCGAPPL
jgi:hypothetical protein